MSYVTPHLTLIGAATNVVMGLQPSGPSTKLDNPQFPSPPSPNYDSIAFLETEW